MPEQFCNFSCEIINLCVKITCKEILCQVFCLALLKIVYIARRKIESALSLKIASKET